MMQRTHLRGRAALVVGLVLSSTVCAQTPAPTFLFGSPADAQVVGRVVTLQPDTRWVNVEQGEVVRFVSGSTRFAWRFDGRDGRSFDLQSVAPPGALTRAVTVYVARTPGHPP